MRWSHQGCGGIGQWPAGQLDCGAGMRGVIGQRRRNAMFKILIIEGILSLLIGAVVFRLAWAFGKSNGVSWGLTAFLAVIVLIFSPGQIDSGLIGEYGGGRALSFLS